MKTMKTMTVGEIKAFLEEFPDNTPVAFSYPSGDHWHTKLVGAINNADHADIRYTDYHQTFRVVDEEEDKDKGDYEVLILG